jgi:translation initiation factor 3 subunit E
MDSDFFLSNSEGDFLKSARLYIFENYCRIHQKIGIETLGEKLAMPSSEAERWIVDLIRNAMLDAKIDSGENCVVMGNTNQSVYQQVISKTKDLTQRSSNLTSTLGHIVNEAKKEKGRKAREARDAEY